MSLEMTIISEPNVLSKNNFQERVPKHVDGQSTAIIIEHNMEKKT